MRFNNGNSALSVNCTLLTGFQGAAGAVMVNKSTAVPRDAPRVIQFSAVDTSDPADTTLGNSLVGVNCALPTDAVINDAYIG
jgi:hypothetical protein